MSVNPSLINYLPPSVEIDTEEPPLVFTRLGQQTTTPPLDLSLYSTPLEDAPSSGNVLLQQEQQQKQLPDRRRRLLPAHDREVESETGHKGRVDGETGCEYQELQQDMSEVGTSSLHSPDCLLVSETYVASSFTGTKSTCTRGDKLERDGGRKEEGEQDAGGKRCEIQREWVKQSQLTTQEYDLCQSGMDEKIKDTDKYLETDIQTDVVSMVDSVIGLGVELQEMTESYIGMCLGDISRTDVIFHQLSKETSRWYHMEGRSDQENKSASEKLPTCVEEEGSDAWEVVETGGDGTVEEKDQISEGDKSSSTPSIGFTLARALTYPIAGRSPFGDDCGENEEAKFEKIMERGTWYELENPIRKGKEAGRKEIEQLKAPQIAEPETFDTFMADLMNILNSCNGSGRGYPLYSTQDPGQPTQYSFEGYDGAFESTMQEPDKIAPRRWRPVQSYEYSRLPRPTAATQLASRSKRIPRYDREYAKSWLRSRASRGRTFSNSPKSNEDRLLEWLNAEVDGNPSLSRDEIIALTTRVFEILKRGSAIGGPFTPAGIMGAPAGAYLAAQTALLGILPVIGLGKANCVNCKREVGRSEDEVWWRCKGCPNGKGFICGVCFVRDGKCGGGHTVDSINHHPYEKGEREVGHALSSRKTKSDHDITSDVASERKYTPPPSARRTKSEVYIASLPVPPVSVPRSAPQTLSSSVYSQSSFGIDTPNYGMPSSKSTSDSSPEDRELSYSVELPMNNPEGRPTKCPEFVFPPPVVTMDFKLLRKYSPAPHVPKPRTESISSMLPGFPTPPQSPSPKDDGLEKAEVVDCRQCKKRECSCASAIWYTGK